jgi:hypothetical protein
MSSKLLSLNSFDYYVLVIETVKNYCAYNGLNDPYNFKLYQRKFYENILTPNNLTQLNTSNTIKEDDNDILNITTILNRIKNFVKYNKLQFRELDVFRINWTEKLIKMFYKLLANIYSVKELTSINNMLELNDQLFLNINFDEDEDIIDDNNPFNTKILFKYSANTQQKIDKTRIPLVLFDTRLGIELDIPDFELHYRTFILDCRSDFYLELMKRWEDLFTDLSNCKLMNTVCSRNYTRTGQDIIIWGKCEDFYKKTKKLPPATIKFHKHSIWQKYYNSYKILLNVIFHL